MMHLRLVLAPCSLALVSFTKHNFLLSTENLEQENHVGVARLSRSESLGLSAGTLQGKPHCRSSPAPTNGCQSPKSAHGSAKATQKNQRNCHSSTLSLRIGKVGCSAQPFKSLRHIHRIKRFRIPSTHILDWPSHTDTSAGSKMKNNFDSGPIDNHTCNSFILENALI